MIYCVLGGWARLDAGRAVVAAIIIQARDTEGSDQRVNIEELRTEVDRVQEKEWNQGGCLCFWPESQEGWSCHPWVGEGITQSKVGGGESGL